MSFGKQSISVGSAPNCDVVVQGPGIQPEHARIVHQGGGQLLFIPAAPGCTAQGRPLAPGEQAPFDLRTPFNIGPVAVPLSHPAITQQILAFGQGQAPAGHLIIGRDPARASLILQHGSVSSMHATVMLDRMMIVDHGSTSGTYVGRNKIAPNTPTPIDPNGIVAFGPVPVQVSLLAQIARGGVGQAQAGAAPAMAGAAAPGAPKAAMGGGGGHPASPGTQAISGDAAMMIAQASLAANASLAAAGSVPSGAPVARKNKTILGQVDFSQQPVKSIGRTPDNDIVISHAQVSSRHALLHSIGGAFFIEDRGSGNGTFVRGQRIPAGQKIAVASGEKIYIGPMPLQIQASGNGAEVVQEDFGGGDSSANWAGRPLYEIEAWSLVLEVNDRDNPSVKKTLLDNVSFKALPGDMIALMGPSGAGKTTLLMALNGYLPPTSGVVRINGEDLYSIYDTLRGSIGYVPQDDLVHPELTVFEAVRYSARFRLPPDYSDAEINQRVEQTLKDLGLDGLRNLQIGKPEKKILSGGQRKRVNIALELVTDPVIVFLDEPTSGLAADDTTALIELLSKLTAATGKTIIMTIHQPAKDEFEKFTHCLIMGYGGVPAFFGQVKQAYQFFGTWKTRQGQPNDLDNPRDLFDMLAQRENPLFERKKAQNPNYKRSDAKKEGAMEWRAEFFNDQNPIYRQMYSGRRSIGTGDGQRGLPPGRASTSGQLRQLLSRYWKVKTRDVSGLLIMLLQAPIIGFLLAGVFGSMDDSVPGWCLGALQQLQKNQPKMQAGGDVLKGMEQTTDATGAIFFLVVSAVWFGTSNAAREIVSERAIYLRERMVNLGLVNYVLSKYLMLCMFCIVQCTMLLAIVFAVLGFHGGAEAFFMQLAGLVATSFVAVALGLLLSTAVTSSEAAMALTPIALIPQVVLGGLIVPMTTVSNLKPIFAAMPARWGFEIVVATERAELSAEPGWSINLMNPALNASKDFVEKGRFDCAMAQVASDTYSGAWGFSTYEDKWLPFAVLGGMALVQLVILLVLLKRRDPV